MRLGTAWRRRSLRGVWLQLQVLLQLRTADPNCRSAICCEARHSWSHTAPPQGTETGPLAQPHPAALTAPSNYPAKPLGRGRDPQQTGGLLDVVPRPPGGDQNAELLPQQMLC